MTAYYNEIHPGKAEVLRNMIAKGLIPKGDVDERSIADVTPNDLAGYKQCHFFAGVGIWALALRLAGWSDHREVWTGSCPCQPFSSAGKGAAFDDERHLWPAWFHLISECQPPVIYAEQVASKDGLGWLDLVQADMEGTDYAGGFVDLCAAGFGTPHIRQRLYGIFRLADTDCRSSKRKSDLQGWDNYDGTYTRRTQDSRDVTPRGRDERLADTDRDGQHQAGVGIPAPRHDGPERNGSPIRLDDSLGPRLEGHRGNGDRSGEPGRLLPIPAGPAAASGSDGGLGDADSETVRGQAGGRNPQEAETRDRERSDAIGSSGTSHRTSPTNGGLGHPYGVTSTEVVTSNDAFGEQRSAIRGWSEQFTGSGTAGGNCIGDNSAGRGEIGSTGDMGRMVRPGPTNGVWGDADWLFCRDGKWRAVEPGSSPLAHGLPLSVGKLLPGVRGLAELAGLDAASLKRAKAYRKLTIHSYGDGIVLQQAAEFIRCSQ